MRVLSGEVNLGRKINLSKRKKKSSNCWWGESNSQTGKEEKEMVTCS